MKKMTVVRQNRCDREMNVVLFGCFFIYFAMQLFIGETGQARLVNGVNMLLYLVFAPGFLFRLGYRFGTISREKNEEQAKHDLGQMALICYLAFFAMTLAHLMFVSGLPLSHSFYRTLMLLEIPGSSALFLAMALMLFGAMLFYRQLKELAEKPAALFAAAGLFALTAVFRAGGEAYAVTGALFGADQLQAIPVLPYISYFLIGIWFEEKKPGFDWQIAGIAAAVTVVSLLLYRTPLQNVVRVTASLLPVYLVYLVGEVISDLTVRFRVVRFVTGTIEVIFAFYAAALFALRFLGIGTDMGVKQVCLLVLGVTALLYGVVLGIWLFSKIYGVLADRFAGAKHKTAWYFVIYTAVFGLLLVLTFHNFLLEGRSLLWQADGVSQYYPRAVYFADTIREMVSGLFNGNFELPMYDFRLGMGGEVTYSLEPLYFLFAAFGREKVEFTYTLLILLRFYLAGISMSVFCLYFKKDYLTTFIASCVYVFCGFSLFGGARHSMFMIPMILFPLLILAMEEILRGRRWYLCTIFVALSLFSNYYFLYMSTIGMGIYALVRFFSQEDKAQKTWKKFWQKFFVICGSYLLGIGMSCIVLVTTFGLYVGSGRSGSAIIKTPSLFYYSAQWLVRCFLCFPTTANSPGDWLKLGFLPIAFLALAFLFARKGRKELKILSVIAGVLVALPLSGFVFNGFSAVSNRWCYMLALLVAYIVADCLPEMYRMTKKEKMVCAAMTAVYAYAALSGMYQESTGYMKLAAVCIAATFGGLLLCQEEVRRIKPYMKQSLMVLMTLVMIFVNGETLFGLGNVVSEYVKPGVAQRYSENTPLRAVKELEDDSFYRVSTPKLDYSTISSSIMLDYNSVSMFNSTFNGSIQEYLEAMGSTGYSVTQFFGLSNRAYMNAPAAVKYYAYYDEPARPLPYGYEPVLETEVDGKKTTVCENKFALPLGYTYDKAISREELEQYDVLERQEVLMQRVMLEDVEDQGTDGIAMTQKPLPYTITVEKGLRYADGVLVAADVPTEAEETGAEETKKKYAMELKFKGEPDSETYIVFKNAVLKGDMSERAINVSFKSRGNKLSYKFRSDDDRYGTQQQDYVFNLGYQEKAIGKCVIQFDRAGEIQCDAIEVYSQPMKNMEKYTEALTENVLENVSMGKNEINGTVSLEKDKLLVLSIPCQKGWTAYVDGEETKLQRANYMYMALPLSAGDHTIRLTFAIPGVNYALIIMPASAVLFAVLLLAGRIRRIWEKRKEKKQAKSEAGKHSQER